MIEIRCRMAYWGRFGGKIMKDGTLGIQQQQWGVGRTNSGGVGRAAKRKRTYKPSRKEGR